MGDEAKWHDATAALDAAVKAEGLECELDEGGGAFYGPKIDIKIKDALNREWQCSTIQFDFNMPDRFDMTFTGSNNERLRPYMIHRALLGSIERFMGVLVEHYAGALPLWLSPVQVRVIPISDRFLEYGRQVFDACMQGGLRVELDDRAEKVGYKIRDAETNKIPLMAVVGEKEKEAGTVSMRRHRLGDQGSIGLADFVKLISDEAKTAAGRPAPSEYHH